MTFIVFSPATGRNTRHLKASTALAAMRRREVYRAVLVMGRAQFSITFEGVGRLASGQLGA